MDTISVVSAKLMSLHTIISGKFFVTYVPAHTARCDALLCGTFIAGNNVRNFYRICLNEIHVDERVSHCSISELESLLNYRTNSNSMQVAPLHFAHISLSLHIGWNYQMRNMETR